MSSHFGDITLVDGTEKSRPAQGNATSYCLSESNHAFAAVKAGITQPEWSAPGLGSISSTCVAPSRHKVAVGDLGIGRQHVLIAAAMV